MVFILLKACSEMIKNCENHLLKANRSHYIVILSKLEKGSELGFSFHNGTKNKLKIVDINYTHVSLNFILILRRILIKESKV